MAHHNNGRRSTLAATVVAAALLAVACATPPPPPSSAAPTVARTPVITPDPHLPDPTTADQVYLALGAAGLRMTANNAASGADDSPLVKRINATFLGWPLAVSQYRTTAALEQRTDWAPDARPSQGEVPVAIAGLNVLIEWGPTTDTEPRAPSGKQVQGLRDLAAALDVLLSPLRIRSVVAIPGIRSTASADPSGEASPAPKATPAP
ncbi:MAG: hypothetical protein ABIQ58_08000 [Candidatus Limnocylindrales bacterium]